MSKKYLSLEEAAAMLHMAPDEVVRLREKGELRGFADRGTWKFKSDDLDELIRRRQTDSDPDVPMLGAGDLLEDGDDLFMPAPPKPVKRDLSIDDSDSDVRLASEGSLARGDDDLSISMGESDSDVRLVDDSDSRIIDVTTGDPDSDSDVKLTEADSDSDVRLAADAPGALGSDSDVKLVAPEDVGAGSDSDVALISDEPSGGGADDSALLTDDDSAILSDSGITLESASDSGISLDMGDSGISLDMGDSGIALADTGSAFRIPDDSGIALDSGAGGKFDKTMPSMKTTGGGRADMGHTEVEVPLVEESDYEIGARPPSGGKTTDSSVIMFDDEMDVDGASDTVAVKAAGSGDDLMDESVFDVEDDAGDEFGEDVEEDLDVFDAGDEDFDESFESGESHPSFVSPRGGRVAAAESDWGTPTFVGLAFSTLLMAVCSLMVFDLVRGMWAWREMSTINGTLVDTIGGLFM